MDKKILYLLIVVAVTGFSWVTYEMKYARWVREGKPLPEKEPAWLEYARLIFAVSFSYLLIIWLELLPVMAGYAILSGGAWLSYVLKTRNKAQTETDVVVPGWLEYARIIFALSVIIILIKLLDLAIVLLSLTVVTGVIWGGYALMKRRQKNQSSANTKEPLLVEFSRFLFPVAFVVLVVRGFVVEPFQIPSESMLPTLEKGDYILVNRFAYGLRMPVFQTKLLGSGKPKRGDVVVFQYPKDPSIDYIKRVVGLPGDRIRYVNKQLYINDQPVAQEQRGPYRKQPDKMERLEKIDDVDHSILVIPNQSWPYPNLPEHGEITVPDDMYFMMGDNRDNSNDSRFWGFVPDSHLKGRAFYIWFSWDDENNRIKSERIGSSIK